MSGENEPQEAPEQATDKPQGKTGAQVVEERRKVLEAKLEQMSGVDKWAESLWSAIGAGKPGEMTHFGMCAEMCAHAAMVWLRQEVDLNRDKAERELKAMERFLENGGVALGPGDLDGPGDVVEGLISRIASMVGGCIEGGESFCPCPACVEERKKREN